MNNNFNILLELDGVDGVMVVGYHGKCLYKEFTSESLAGFEAIDFSAFLNSLEAMPAAEFVFENKKMYLKNYGSGYLVVISNFFAPMAMIRLNCDILLPTIDDILKQQHKPSGLGRFFRKK